MDAELQNLQDTAARLGELVRTSRQSVEAAVVELKLKKDALHKAVDETYDNLVKQILLDIVPTNIKG